METNNKNLTKINLKKSLAFTLAEVLIVIAVVGIVAEMVFPALSDSYQKGQYVAGLVKARSAFQQAMTLLANDNNCPNDLSCTGLFGSSTTLGTNIVKYFNIAKDCGTSTAGCWPASFNLNYDGSSGTTTDLTASASYYKFMTVDGMSWGVQGIDATCATNYSAGATTTFGYGTSVCANVFVDINGIKPPNRRGRDVFMFYISDKGPSLYPAGGSDIGSTAQTTYGYWVSLGTCKEGSTTTQNGSTCTGRIFDEGFKMTY